MSKIIVENLYQDTLLKLKEGKRPLILLTPELIHALKKEWQESLIKVLCILGHTQNGSMEFSDLIFLSLNKETNKDNIIFLLATTEKHIIAESLKTGIVPPLELFNILKKLLISKESQVLEWTLRTIEAMGPLNLRLKNDILNIRPSRLRIFFNSHLRNCDEIINLLERQWSQKL